MYEFDIPDMSCGHCAATVTKAIQSVDPAARPEIDLPAHKAKVQTDKAPEALLSALDEAGYPSTVKAM